MKWCCRSWKAFLAHFTENCNFVLALALFFTASESWGRIEPVMIGHCTKKKSDDDSELLRLVNIECFLCKPYPAVIQVWYVYL
jgi:hypothetical protein